MCVLSQIEAPSCCCFFLAQLYQFLSDVMEREPVQPVFSPPGLAFIQHLAVHLRADVGLKSISSLL